MKDDLDEITAFEYEIILIKFFGRKDIETGILRNKCEGGRGNSGRKITEEQRINHYMKRPEWRKIQSDRISGNKNPMYDKGLFGEFNPMYGKTTTGVFQSGKNNLMYGKRMGDCPNSVRCHTSLGWFNSIIEAARAHDVNVGTIYRRIKNDSEKFKEYYK